MEMPKSFSQAPEFIRYIGPGILVTVGFIDPGNWAPNVAAGSSYGYSLLWMITLSTLILIVIQHNAAHLGIVTGLCLSEAIVKYVNPWVAKVVLISALGASIATAMAELLGCAIALHMLFELPIKVGAVVTAALVGWLLYSNSYRRLEKLIIGFVSIVGISFLFELSQIKISWAEAAYGWVVPQIPDGSMPIAMSVLGAVVMPHNLFLHSEVIQSRHWNAEDESVIRRLLRYEFLDTLLSMGIGWAISSAMILVAAATFFQTGIAVTELEQATAMLDPLLGKSASIVFALALLFSGFSSSVTAGMAGGSIFAGAYGESYDIRRENTRAGVLVTLFIGVAVIFLITDPFQGLVVSQMLLSIQLPWTIFMQIRLTSSPKVMGKYANRRVTAAFLWIIGAIVTLLNLMLFKALLGG